MALNNLEAMQYVISKINAKFTNSVMIKSYPESDKPDYPFSTMTPITSGVGYQHLNKSFVSNGSMVDVINNDEPTITLSISVYSNKRDESMVLAQNIQNFLNHESELIITDVAISNIGTVKETNPFIVNAYEFRHTFDIVVRFDQATKYTIEPINSVEL